jgi:hypothetical protein
MQAGSALPLGISHDSNTPALSFFFGSSEVVQAAHIGGDGRPTQDSTILPRGEILYLFLEKSEVRIRRERGLITCISLLSPFGCCRNW